MKRKPNEPTELVSASKLAAYEGRARPLGAPLVAAASLPQILR